MSDTRYLTKRDGLWLFQRRVPKDCRTLFNNKSILTKSLNTHNLREARLRRNQMIAEMDMMIQKHRANNNDMSDTTHYRSLVSMYMDSSDDALEASYNKLITKIESLIGDKDIKPDLSHLQNQLVTMSQDERTKVLIDEQQKAYIDQIPDAEERVHAQALQNAYIGIKHDLAYISLKEALKQHLADNGQNLKVNTTTQVKKSVTAFLEVLGQPDIALKDIGRKMVKTFITAKLQTHSGSTVKTYVAFLSSIWKHAGDLELIDGANPFAGHKVNSEPTESFQLFEKNELTAIFKETEEYKDTEEDYKYLLPRLGYVTGCRIEELASMTCEQLVTDEESGILYFSVQEGKTSNAKRKIPIHDWVLGDVIAQKEKVGTGFLFPTLTTQRNDGKRGDRVSKWFGRLKDKHLTVKGKKGFHSFRVHVATGLERGYVLESTAVWILGHTRNLSLSYGLYSDCLTISQLKEAIDVIKIDKEWANNKTMITGNSSKRTKAKRDI